MDFAARLIVGLVLVLFAGSALAYGVVPKTMVPVYDCPFGGAAGDSGKVFYGRARTGPGACAAWIAQVSPWTNSSGGTTTRTITSCSASSCSIALRTTYPNSGYVSEGTGSISFVLLRVESGCPDFANAVGTTACECAPGFRPEASACVPLQCPVAGKYTAITQPDQAVKNVGDGICQGGCGYTPTGYKIGTDGTIWAGWPFKSTGKACQGLPDAQGASTGEENTKNPSPLPCGANQCPGTVSMNGATTQMCVACKGTAAPPTTEAASAPAGSASGAGDITKSTQTTCDGVTCTTTTTTRDGAGAVVGSSEKKEAQENFCQQNPQSQLCKKSSFGGSCAATTCDGDAVQCALAQETYKRNCQLYDDPKLSTMAEVGNAAMAAGDTPAGHPGAPGAVQAGSVAFSSAINTSSPIAAACPASYTVAGPFGPLTMDLSALCSSLALLGNIMVAVTWLACAFIVFK